MPYLLYKLINAAVSLLFHFTPQVYRGRNITNIVEAPRSVKIDNWCKVGHRKCKTTQSVKPYRCLGKSDGSFLPSVSTLPQVIVSGPFVFITSSVALPYSCLATSSFNGLSALGGTRSSF